MAIPDIVLNTQSVIRGINPTLMPVHPTKDNVKDNVCRYDRSTLQPVTITHVNNRRKQTNQRNISNKKQKQLARRRLKQHVCEMERVRVHVEQDGDHDPVCFCANSNNPTCMGAGAGGASAVSGASAAKCVNRNSSAVSYDNNCDVSMQQHLQAQPQLQPQSYVQQNTQPEHLQVAPPDDPSSAIQLMTNDPMSVFTEIRLDDSMELVNRKKNTFNHINISRHETETDPWEFAASDCTSQLDLTLAEDMYNLYDIVSYADTRDYTLDTELKTANLSDSCIIA